VEGRLKANYTRGSKLVVGLVSVHPAKQSLVRKVGESGSLGNPSLMEERAKLSRTEDSNFSSNWSSKLKEY
jgi:hypothetical protein